MILILIYVATGCKKENQVEVIDKKSNIWNYKNQFEIQLPKGFYFSYSVIYDQDDAKVGEVFLDNQKLLERMSGMDFINTHLEHSQIKTDQTTYWADCFDCKILKTDSALIGNKFWYYVIEQSAFETSKEGGTWNSFLFADIYKNHILLLSFYNMETDDESIDNFSRILRTVNYN